MDVLKFYLDTHIDKQVAIQLRHNGVDVVRCEEVGLAEADDEDHLIYATQEGRVTVTFDQGFRDRAFNWLAAGRSHGGVLICSPVLQGQGAIGAIVQRCLFYCESIKQGAATMDDFRNQVLEIKRGE